nr:uncharacterized protein LOC119168536 [Rhipicephalus microplus]
MAEANAQEIVSPTAEASVHALGGQSYRPRSRPQIVGCYRCGAKGHGPEDCRFRSASCFKCKQRGHIARACCRRESGFGVVPPERQVHALSREEDTGTDGMFALEAVDSHIGHVGITQPIVRTLDCGGVPVNMQVDTGSPVSVITWPTYERNKTVWPKLRGSPLKLTCFLGRLPVRGQLQLKVSCGNKSTAGSLQVLGCSGPNLCGRDLIQAFHMLEAPVMNVNTSGEQLPLLGADDVNVDRLLAEFADVFAPGLGLIKGPPVHFETRENVVPKFWKAREVPYAFRPKVDAELDRLSGAGIIVPVPHAEWAAPVVPVVKRNGCIRLCGDFKLTVNKACRTEQYPLPRVEDILATLNGGEVFTTIDLREAYNQLPLDEEAMQLATINTHKGLFSFTRLPFGVASAPAVFQRRMETILQGLPGVQVYQDDVIVAEKRNDCTTLHEVFKRFREYGVRLNADKCKFRQLEVDFLGHRISARGLQPKTENIDAILKVQAPRNSAELRSYLGMVTYYHKFLPNASTAMAPLYQLLRKEAKWKWDTAQQQSFSSVKDLLKSADFLAHFDPHKPLVLECDASPDGIGAVLSHDVGGGVLRPIGFRSRLLTGAEKNYSQLEREALALVFDRPVPVMAAARIQRWALLLSAYDYVIKHQPGKTTFQPMPSADSPRQQLPSQRRRKKLWTSNGLAERAVRTVKYSLKKNVQGSLKTRLARILHRYRRTPQAGGRTPAQLLMGYDLRSRLDNAVSIPPSPVDRPPLDGWQPGEPVWVRNFGRGEPWTPASITSTDGARLVNADGPEGETIRRHSDQVKPRELEHDQGEVGDSRCLETAGGALAGGTPRRAPTRSGIAGSPSTPVLRRSGRQRKPPDRYSP